MVGKDDDAVQNDARDQGDLPSSEFEQWVTRKRWYDHLPGPVQQWFFAKVHWRWHRFTYDLRRAHERAKLARNIGPLEYMRIRNAFLAADARLRAEYSTLVKRGRLDAFAETGTEGFIWQVYEDGKTGYEGMVNLDPGDRLLVYLHDGSVAFDGIIDKDHEVGYRPFPMNPQYGQPCAFDCWIHWTQRGWTAEEWASLFLHGQFLSDKHPRLAKGTDLVPYRAIVVKADRPNPDAN